MKGQITQALVEALKPRAHDFFVWDSVDPGFGLKMTPAGRCIYIYQYRLGGRATPTKRITLGSNEDGWTVKKARVEARKLARTMVRERISHHNSAVASGAPPGRSVETWQIRLGFLASDIARLQNTLLRRAMKTLGASHTQWGMLGQLASRQGVTQMELAKILGLSKVAVTGLVDRVVRAGWVVRRLDDRDRRVRRLFLTPKAKSAVAGMRKKVDVMIAASMGHILDAKGLDMVHEFEGIKDRLLKLAPGVRRRKAGSE
jgi:DNA-binding MarR family transcriptional regulator